MNKNIKQIGGVSIFVMGAPPILFLKVFDQTFSKKFVSSKGKALSRSPQRAEPPSGVRESEVEPQAPSADGEIPPFYAFL